MKQSSLIFKYYFNMIFHHGKDFDTLPVYVNQTKSLTEFE